jgi:hypothetical protein
LASPAQGLLPPRISVFIVDEGTPKSMVVT